MGVKLTGAGGGGCICILVENGSAPRMMEWLDKEYFGRAENFREYRAILERFSTSSEPDERSLGEEKKANLEEALANLDSARMTVRFSSGAGPLDLG